MQQPEPVASGPRRALQLPNGAHPGPAQLRLRAGGSSSVLRSPGRKQGRDLARGSDFRWKQSPPLVLQPQGHSRDCLFYIQAVLREPCCHQEPCDK